MLKSLLLNNNFRLDKTRLVRYLTFASVLFVIFSLLEIALFRLVLNFEIYQGWAAWYFPAGLRVAALLILPFRFWPFVILAGSFGQQLHHIVFFDKPIEAIYRVLPDIFKVGNVIATAVVAGVKTSIKNKPINYLKPLIAVLFAAVIYRLSRTLHLLNDSTVNLFYQDIPEQRYFEMILNHFLGGMVGVLVVLPIAYYLKVGWQSRKNIDWTDVLIVFNQLAVVCSVFVAIYFIQPHTYYLLRILAIIPLIWFSYKFAWFGAISSLIIMNTLIMLKTYGLNESELMIENQLYIISYSLTALFIGAVINEQGIVRRKLEANNKELERTNDDLMQSTIQTQKLANRAVEVQEHERKKLSQELHDEVGQSITALKTELKVLQLKLSKSTYNADFQKVNDVSDQIYDSVYSVLNWLRPRVLDEFGLEECLKGRYVSSRLINTGIDYYCNITGCVALIPESMQITILRICQEAVTNCIKHSNASSLKISLTIEDDIRLFIKDDGDQSPDVSSESGGFGLQNIEDRVLSHGGYIVINKDDGFALFIEVPLSKENS